MKRILFFILILSVALWWAWGKYSTGDVLKWSDAHKSSPVSEKVDYYLGIANYMRGEKGKAVDALSQLLANHTTSQYAPAALFRRAQLRYDSNEFPEALEDYSRFLELYPDHPNAAIAARKTQSLRSR